tara:strand:- start:298 stop:1836 length:1539 start_codon:yes stop_codon:yes gene_type:complete
MTITLANINDTLREQTVAITEEQMVTQNRVKQLSKSFDTFITMLQSEDGDDLEAEREAKKQTKVARKLDSKEGGKASSFDLGNLIPFAAGMVGGLLKRGIPALLGVLLADELGEQVKKMTGSDFLANVTEWSAMGGAFGFLFGGVKGGILGAVIGAIFSEASRDKIAEILSDITDKEIKGTDPEALIGAGALTGLALLAPKIIAKILPLFLGPAGILVLAAGAITTLAFKYFTDDEFRKKADKFMDPLRNKIDELMSGIANSAKDYINKIFPDFVTTDAENLSIDQMMKPEDLAAQRAAEADIAKSKPLFKELNEVSKGFSQSGRLERMKKFAAEQGIDMSRTATVSSTLGFGKESTLADADDPFRLHQEITKILAARTAESKEVLKKIEVIRKDLERQLQAKDSVTDSSQSDIKIKIKALEAQQRFTTVPSEKRFIQSQLDALRPLTKSVSPSINPNELTKATTPPSVNAPVVDASVTNLGQSTTALVGSGANSFDANNPLVQRAMANLHG